MKTLLFGQEENKPTNKLRPAFKNQCLNVKRIWKNKHYNDFGIERILRLFLAISLFVFQGLYIRDFFGRFGLLWRKIGVEIYVILKLILPLLFFYYDLTDNIIVAIISGYMIIETMIYLASLIFLSNEFAKPISHRRSITGLFINYFQVCLDFAVIYSYCNLQIPNFFNKVLSKDIDAIYFSFVTSATVGYGDIYVQTDFGKILVILQIILFLVFVGLFINFFGSKIQDPTYFNAKPEYSGYFGQTVPPISVKWCHFESIHPTNPILSDAIALHSFVQNIIQ